MTATHQIASEITTGLVSTTDADERSVPELTIDVDAAEIVDANSAGAAAFGIFSYATFPIAIDPALPGIARLRDIIASISEPRCETLMFRSGGRLRSMNFRISKSEMTPAASRVRLEIIDDDAPEPAADVSLLEAKDAAHSTADAPASETKPAPPAPNSSAPTAPRDDAETLKQIARRIREGSGARDTTRSLHEAATESNRRVTERGTEDQRAGEGALQWPPGYPQRRPSSPLDPDHLAHLAHELKTPLTAIAAASEVMRDERLGPMGNRRYLDYASDIHESARHALDVIASLLSESGKPGDHAARLIALDLNAIVARTVSSVQALAEMHRISLAFDADRGQPHVVANPTAIRQILLNLMTNAIKFTPAGGDVRVVTGYLDDGRVFLVVRDTGCGMAGKTSLKHVEASASQAKLSPGLGIGLPLVRRLVSEMGADLEIDSAPGKGTVVLIAFGGFARWSAPE